MKYQKVICVLVVIIAVLSMVASVSGIFMDKGMGEFEFKSIYGETVSVCGKGLYWADSVSIAAQAKGQDVVTVIAVPLLLISMRFSIKGFVKGRLLLAGIIGYFLYTYISYSFLIMYNPLFLIYVMLMSLSFFAFVLVLMSFDLNGLDLSFKSNLPVRFIGGFLIFFAVLLSLMWLGMILPPQLEGAVPSGLEHYTSFGIQAMDIGFVVPAAILSGVLLIRRKSFGYLLSSVITVKLIALSTAVIAMIIVMVLEGVKVGLMDMLFFSILDLIAIVCLILIMRNTKEA